MEPLSITAASVGLLSSIFTLTKSITQFASDVRDARKDMERTRGELSELELAVETLQKDALSDELQFPDSLQYSLTQVLLNCDTVVKDISSLLITASDGKMARVRWAMKGQTEMNKLRQHLEAHKATLDIALEMASICLLSKVKEDTLAIRIGTVDIKQDTTAILDQMGKLQSRFEDVGNGRTLILQRFLDESTTYTQSIIDPIEELPSIIERPSSPISGEATASNNMPIQDSFIDFTAAKQARGHLSSEERARLDQELLTICNRTPPDFEAAESVLREGADCNYVGPFRNSSSSSLCLAAEFGTVKLVTILLGWGAEIDLQNEDGWTALMLATSCGHLAVVELLLDRRAQIDLRDKDGRTALMTASRYGYPAVVEILLDRRAQIDLQNEDGWTALMLATSCGHLAVVELLLDRRAQIDLQNEYGRTALMLASGCGHLAVVELLLDRRAQIDLQNEDGWTALMTASAYGQIAVVELLLDRRAQIDLQNEDGWTALMLASRYGYTAVVELLRKRGYSS